MLCTAVKMARIARRSLAAGYPSAGLMTLGFAWHYYGASGAVAWWQTEGGYVRSRARARRAIIAVMDEFRRAVAQLEDLRFVAGLERHHAA